MTGLRRGIPKDHGLGFLSESQIEQIHSGALELLGRVGVVIHSEPVLKMLARDGCQVDYQERRARLPRPLVMQAVARAPRVVKLFDRLGECAMALGEGPFYTRTSSGATHVLDLESGQRRQATSTDAADAARVADALPHVHGVSTMAVQPGDVPVALVDVCALQIALANTTKPLGYVCLNEALIEPLVAMAALVAGGEEALRERPFITALAESTSPLRLVASQLAVLQAFASRGLPLTLHAHPIAGFTAPVTLAGELVVTHAEVMALVTIAQTVRPGTPVIYGMSSSVADMRSGRNLSGAVEIGILGAAVAGLARHCGLPSLMSSGTDALTAGAQSVLERLMTLLPPALAGIDLVNLTTLGTKMTFSLEQLILDQTMLALVERCLRGIAVERETLALDLIEEIGPAGAYIDTAHTRHHHRGELLIPELIVRQTQEAWETAGMPTLPSRVKEEARMILAEHRPAPLPAGVDEQLDEMVRAVKAEYTKRGENTT